MNGSRVLACGGLASAICLACGYSEAAGWVMIFVNIHVLLWGK
jgi:hypothetical protein